MVTIAVLSGNSKGKVNWTIPTLDIPSRNGECVLSILKDVRGNKTIGVPIYSIELMEAKNQLVLHTWYTASKEMDGTLLIIDGLECKLSENMWEKSGLYSSTDNCCRLLYLDEIKKAHIKWEPQKSKLKIGNRGIIHVKGQKK